MPWNDLTPGTLIDEEIKHLGSAGKLITDAFDSTSVRQCCYELRASTVFWNVASPEENKRIDTSEKGYLLKPHTFVTVIVMETIELPPNILARILTKGQLLSIGLLPVNTYADPGFQGRLGITVCNLSHRYIVIRPGQPIAKIEFTVLPKEVGRPYSGQHGFETQIWPLPLQHYAELDDPEFAAQRRDTAKEIGESHGPLLGDLARRFLYYEKKLWLQISVVVLGFSAILVLHERLSLVTSLVLGVIANLLTSLLIALGSKRARS